MHLQNVNELYKKLLRHEINTDEDLHEFINVIAQNTSTCISCFKSMKVRKKEKNKTILRCNFCNSTKRIYNLRSKFSNAISLKSHFYFIIYFIKDLCQETISEFLGISISTVSRYFLKLQKLIHDFTSNNPIKIGGSGKIVQIDECFFGKRKYNRGRLANEQIVLGGIDVESKNFFITIIPNRKKETIGYNIEKYVNEKSIIHTDKHTSYIYYFAENSNKYYHDWVNHSENFVDPETYVHTQNIENLWLLLKKFKRRKGYSKSRYLKLYLAEFDLKRRFYREESRLFEFLINLTFI
ncbi:hypothetical protein H312_01414 [Anncaliia algerae PRA339]|uniref:ISXO2-like transposase domain-containing protein n=1 Tax=Anncaliia algerae PRA339 TaxID=1288291 RepID=A0A059F208_9MICR|nr:hypothetical protein H312_01414 [Anncaliia algerae PRA339]